MLTLLSFEQLHGSLELSPVIGSVARKCFPVIGVGRVSRVRVATPQFAVQLRGTAIVAPIQLLAGKPVERVGIDVRLDVFPIIDTTEYVEGGAQTDLHRA